MIIIRNIICLAGIVCVSPILIIALVCIVIEDGYPIFFKQERIGKNKKIFNIYKLRTMKTNAPQLGTHQVGLSYMLKIGKVIRACKLDEFPQLFNVLKGDINLVGPRPGLVVQQELTQERSKKDIFDIKPGITGLAQILGYDMSDPKKLAEIDKIYMNNRSYKVNALVFLGTFFPVLKNNVSKSLKIKIKQKNR